LISTSRASGRLVLRHAETIIARLKAAQADVAAMIHGEGRSLRVGTFQSEGARILPTLVHRFRAAWPGVEVQLTESVSDSELLGPLAAGSAAGARTAAGDRRAAPDRVAALPQAGAGGCALPGRRLQPKYVFHSDENTTVHGLVAAGAGFALIPRLAVDQNDRRVALGQNVPPRVIALAWDRDRYQPPVADAFIELAESVCAELERRSMPIVAAAG
jgi:DNA-binding transcriptional LysR family regulator